MKKKTKFTCPQCERSWEKDSLVKARVERAGPGSAPGVTCYIEVSKVPFCLYCLLGHDGKRAEEADSFIDQYSCKGDLVLLEKKEVQLTHMILKNDMGKYVEVPIKNIPQLHQYINSKYFDQEEDYDADIGDHNSVWGGAGPDCEHERLETATH